MADFPQVRRILHMHPAHRTVGVSGVASSFRLCQPLEQPSAGRLPNAPVRVSLVSCATDKQGSAAMAAFERILFGKRGIECGRVDLASAEAQGLAGANCAVVFARGVQIIGRWSAFDAAFGEGGFEEDDGFETEVEIAAAARWHPLLDGVGTFIARHRYSHSSYLHPSSPCLLVRKWAGDVFPLAWTQEREGRAFYTLLGHPDDFRRREFVRLLLNAIEWIGG